MTAVHSSSYGLTVKNHLTVLIVEKFDFSRKLYFYLYFLFFHKALTRVGSYLYYGRICLSYTSIASYKSRFYSLNLYRKFIPNYKNNTNIFINNICTCKTNLNKKNEILQSYPIRSEQTRPNPIQYCLLVGVVWVRLGYQRLILLAWTTDEVKKIKNCIAFKNYREL